MTNEAVPAILPALTSKLVDARKKKEDAESAVSEASKQIEEAEIALATALAEAGLESFRCELGLVTPSVRTFFSVPKENQDAVMSTLEQHEPGILKKSVHPQTLGAFIRETEKEAPPDWWKSFRLLITAHTKNVITIRK